MDRTTLRDSVTTMHSLTHTNRTAILKYYQRILSLEEEVPVQTSSYFASTNTHIKDALVKWVVHWIARSAG